MSAADCCTTGSSLGLSTKSTVGTLTRNKGNIPKFVTHLSPLFCAALPWDDGDASKRTGEEDSSGFGLEFNPSVEEEAGVSGGVNGVEGDGWICCCCC